MVTLNCPASNNRIDQTLAAEIRQVCREIREDSDVNLVLFIGSGDCFSVGRLPVPSEGANGEAHSICNRTAADSRMRPGAVGNSHAQDDFVGTWCVGNHHGHGIEMIE